MDYLHQTKGYHFGWGRREDFWIPLLTEYKKALQPLERALGGLLPGAIYALFGAVLHYVPPRQKWVLFMTIKQYQQPKVMETWRAVERMLVTYNTSGSQEAPPQYMYFKMQAVKQIGSDFGQRDFGKLHQEERLGVFRSILAFRPVLPVEDLPAPFDYREEADPDFAAITLPEADRLKQWINAGGALLWDPKTYAGLPKLFGNQTIFRGVLIPVPGRPPPKAPPPSTPRPTVRSTVVRASQSVPPGTRTVRKPQTGPGSRPPSSQSMTSRPLARPGAPFRSGPQPPGSTGKGKKKKKKGPKKGGPPKGPQPPPPIRAPEGSGTLSVGQVGFDVKLGRDVLVHTEAVYANQTLLDPPPRPPINRRLDQSAPIYHFRYKHASVQEYGVGIAGFRPCNEQPRRLLGKPCAHSLSVGSFIGLQDEPLIPRRSSVALVVPDGEYRRRNEKSIKTSISN